METKNELVQKLDQMIRNLDELGEGVLRGDDAIQMLRLKSTVRVEVKLLMDYAEAGKLTMR